MTDPPPHPFTKEREQQTMSKFALAAMYGSKLEIVSSLDPAIDWTQSEITKEEYNQNPAENLSKLRFLEGVSPIKIYVHLPTEEEKMIAMHEGKLDIDLEKSGVEYRGDIFAPGTGAILGLALTQCCLTSLCIDTVENLDGWPKIPKKKDSFGFNRLTPEAEKCFGPKILKDTIFKEIGRFLMEAGTQPEKK